MSASPSPRTFFHRYDLKILRSTRAKVSPAPHQNVALAKLHAWYDSTVAGPKGGILALPTGGGMTFTAIHFLCTGPLSDGYKVLWLAHTHHLLEQAFYSFAGLLPHVGEPRSTLDLRVVSGTPGHFRPSAIKRTDDIVVATLQTITGAHREKLEALTKFIHSAGGKLIIVFDEAHHAPAPSYRTLIREVCEDGAQVLGLTATPTYTDDGRKGWLKKLFPQGIIAQQRAADLIAVGVLARPNFEKVPTAMVPKFEEVDYQKWLGTYGDLPEHVVAQLAGSMERNAFIAATYAGDRARYGKTIIFTDRYFQCEAIVAALEKHDVRAGALYSHVDADLPSVEARQKRDADENAKVLERFRKGDLDVIVNVRMLTEGTDVPDVQTVFLTRQTTSQILLTQMVGRALRGPKFGGTSEAYIVAFTDEWQQMIQWAEYTELDGATAEDPRHVACHPPLELISIDLIRRLTRQFQGGAYAQPRGPFLSNLPVGWYRVTYDSCAAASEDILRQEQLLMVFEDEREGFQSLIKSLLRTDLSAFEGEALAFEAAREALEELRTEHLAQVRRRPSDLLFDLFHLVRHLAQHRGEAIQEPAFFLFEVRKDHDLEKLAQGFLERNLPIRSIEAQLREEFERPDRFWRALLHRFDLFRNAYDECQRRLLSEGDGTGSEIISILTMELPPSPEPTEQVKALVLERDDHQCLACGASKHLQVDHITPVYRGGSNELENLQTLCGECNRRKGIRRMPFLVCRTALEAAPSVLEQFKVPDSDGDRTHWERFLRRTLNFTLQCRAVATVAIGARGDGYYHWTIELMPRNRSPWLSPLLPALFERIQAARRSAGKPELRSLSIVEPGQETLRIEGEPVAPGPARMARGQKPSRDGGLKPVLRFDIGGFQTDE